MQLKHEFSLAESIQNQVKEKSLLKVERRKLVVAENAREENGMIEKNWQKLLHQISQYE